MGKYLNFIFSLNENIILENYWNQYQQCYGDRKFGQKKYPLFRTLLQNKSKFQFENLFHIDKTKVLNEKEKKTNVLEK